MTRVDGDGRGGAALSMKHVTGKPIKTFHLAEGPGGFIESTAYIRNNTNDIYYGITLIDKSGNVPNWKKAEHIIKRYGNINIEYGVNGRGDLYDHKNIVPVLGCVQNEKKLRVLFTKYNKV